MDVPVVDILADIPRIEYHILEPLVLPSVYQVDSI